MDDINGLLRNVVRITSFFLSLCIILWLLVPDWRSVMAGLAVGAVVSLVNAMHLAHKVKRVADYALGGRRTGIGFWTRAAIAVLAVALVLRTPEISLYAMVAGLFFAQMATLLLGIFTNRKDLG